MLSKVSFTRCELDHLLLSLNINNFSMFFFQPFSFKQKAECHVQESSGKCSERGVGSVETETNELGVKELLLSVKKDLPQHLSNIGSFGNQELDQSCVSSRDRKFTRKFRGTLLESQFSSPSPFSSFCSAPLLAQTSLLNAGMSRNFLRHFARRSLLWPSGRAGSPIDVSSEHAPINFSSGKDSFNTDFNDLATTVVASAITATTEVGRFESIRCVWFSAASGSQRHPASSSVVNLKRDTDLRSIGNFVRGVESFPSVERTLSKGGWDTFATIKGENSVWTGKPSWILW